MDNRPIRVIQWATGAVGRSAIRTFIERPEFELVGGLVYERAKVGRDLGEIAGHRPIGVTATDDPAAVAATDADCVSYLPLPGAVFAGDPDHDLRTICRLLESGKNVVTTTGFIYPYAHGADVVDRLTRACRAGGVSVHGTGANPGFMCDLLPLVLSGLSRRVDHVYVRECSDFAGHPSNRLVTGLVGLGRSPAEYTRRLRPYRTVMRAQFGECIHLLADALGQRVDDVEDTHDFLTSDEDLVIAAGPIRSGSVCASRWSFSGTVGGRPFVTIEVVYKSDGSRVRAWEPPGFALRIDGRPAISLASDDDWVSNGIAAAAAHVVNAVPAVCAAEPGIRTILDLPPVHGRTSPDTAAAGWQWRGGAAWGRQGV